MNDTPAATAVKASEKAREASPPARWTPWPSYQEFRREIDRLFEDFDRSFLHPLLHRPFVDTEPFWRRESSLVPAPAVDVVEHDKEFVLSAELPGMDEHSIEVKIANGVLTIRGEKCETRKKEKGNSCLSERRYGAFERSFRIPDSVESEKIDASFRNGVLTMTLPKSAAAQNSERKITVKNG